MNVTSLTDWRRCHDFVVVSALCADLVEPQARRYMKSGRRPAIATGADNDVEMDGGPVKDVDMDLRGQPALPTEETNLCQYSGLARLWIKPICVIIILAGIVFFFAREETKSLFRSDCNMLRAYIDRWAEAGYPSGTNLDAFVGKRSELLVSTQTFLVGAQNFQTRFVLRNPRINWKGGQLFVTTNKVLILHSDEGNRIVQWIEVWPGLDLVNLTEKNSSGSQ